MREVPEILTMADHLVLVKYDGSHKSAIPNLASLITATKGTVSLWFNTSSSGDQCIFQMSNSRFKINLTSDTIFVSWESSTGLPVSNTDTNAFAITENEWHNVVFSWSSGAYWLYLDGVLKETVSGCTFSSFTSGPERIGYDGTNYFTGLIKNIYFYSRLVDLIEVTNLYENNPPTDSVANYNTVYEIMIEDFKKIIAQIAGQNASALTVKIQGSVSDTCPDFYATQSSTNHWDYVSVIDMLSGSVIEGDTGGTFVANVFKDVEINAEGLRWINFIITSHTTGSINVKLKLFYE